ncbi:MAG TPA: hypothetical protein PK198_26895 [Saprospiraceae bacterium]|nr:hypothetical protein [Saprospiraceae bacterium]HRK81947.1 hypothetical protein [Saprospiraceae bacterium]
MRKKVLITVVTYPLPSRSYDELVCTAGVLEDGSWIRIYPVRFQFLTQAKAPGGFEQYKYSWIELDLKKRTDDFRPESHSPINYDFSDLQVLGKIDTKDHWTLRRQHCLKNVYTNLAQLIAESQEPSNVSLATFKPQAITEFLWETDDREWKPEWQAQLQQLAFNFGGEHGQTKKKLIRKLPYKFYYKFKDDAGKSSKLMIEDWEIGQLYWNCLQNANGDEATALQKVRQRYWTEFVEDGNKDIYLFLGTTKQWHQRRASNPFVIVGVFYPSQEKQLKLF